MLPLAARHLPPTRVELPPTGGTLRVERRAEASRGLDELPMHRAHRRLRLAHPIALFGQLPALRSQQLDALALIAAVLLEGEGDGKGG